MKREKGGGELPSERKGKRGGGFQTRANQRRRSSCPSPGVKTEVNRGEQVERKEREEGLASPRAVTTKKKGRGCHGIENFEMGVQRWRGGQSLLLLVLPKFSSELMQRTGTG